MDPYTQRMINGMRVLANDLQLMLDEGGAKREPEFIIKMVIDRLVEIVN